MQKNNYENLIRLSDLVKQAASEESRALAKRELDEAIETVIAVERDEWDKIRELLRRKRTIEND